MDYTHREHDCVVCREETSPHFNTCLL